MKVIKEIILPSLILCIICTVLTAALAATNMLTKDEIARRTEESEKEALNAVIPDASFTKISEEDEIVSYKAVKNGETFGYAFKVSKNGYGGAVTAVIGIVDNKITSVMLTDVSGETPGLGQSLADEKWLSGYNGLTGGNDAPVKTGATITSTAVKNAITLAFEKLEEVAE